MKTMTNRRTNVSEMNYLVETQYVGPLAVGSTNGVEWIILNWGSHPCTYLNVEGTKYENAHYDEIQLNVHGGLTFNGKLDCHPSALWIGWDYAHWGDYNPKRPSLGGHKWTTDELVAEAEEAAKKFALLLKADNRHIVRNKISDTITEKIRLDSKTTVYDALGNAKEMYALIEKSYKLNVPLAPIGKQEFETLKQAQEMEYRLNMMRHNISTCCKAYGIGWNEHKPCVIVIQPTNKADLYWFEETDKNHLWHERFTSFQDAYNYICKQYGISIVERWLTVNSNQSTNKRVLSISDWLLRRP